MKIVKWTCIIISIAGWTMTMLMMTFFTIVKTSTITKGTILELGRSPLQEKIAHPWASWGIAR